MINHFKHLFFLSSLCSCIVLHSCIWGESSGCEKKNIFGICKKGEPCTDCGTVLLAGYISEREATGDPVTCSSVKPEWSSDVYAVIRDCNNNLVTLCGTGDGNETLTINPSDLLEAGEYCS